MFQNFLLGFQAGNEQRLQRQTENALSRIGQQAQANDWAGAASTAFGAGMPDLGGQFRGYGEQERQRQQTQQVGGRLAAGDYAGAQNVAFKTGDLNLGQGILEMTQGLDERQREQALESMNFFANVAGLEQVRSADPMARADVLRQIISNSPFDNPQAQELLNRAAENGISNEELDTFQMQVMDAAQQMQMQQTQQGVALDRALGEAVAQGIGDEALERQIAALPGGGALALQMRDARRQAEEQRRQFNQRLYSGGGGGGGGGGAAPQLSRADATAYNNAVNTAIAAANQGRQFLPMLEEFRVLNQATGTGPGTVISSLYSPNVQRMRAITEAMAPLMRPPGSGAMSDGDAMMYRRGLPNIMNFGGANQAAREMMEARIQNDIDFAGFITYAQSQGIPLSEAQSLWQVYSSNEPLYGRGGETRQRQSWQQYFSQSAQQPDDDTMTFDTATGALR